MFLFRNDKREEIVRAIKTGKTEAVLANLQDDKKLLNSYMQVASVKGKKTILHLAIEHENLKLVKALTKLPGIDLNVRMHSEDRAFDQATPAYLAACFDDPKILKHLIKKKADTSLAIANGQTPLTAATYHNRIKHVKAIIESGKTNVNTIKHENGGTALTNAVEKSDVIVVNMVLAIPGISIINHKKNNGESALFIAVRIGNIKKVIALLKMPGIDIEAKRIPGDGKTALQCAAENSYKEIFNLIRQKQLLIELNQYMDVRVLLQDPMISTPFITQKSKLKDKKADDVKAERTQFSFPSYTDYLLAQRKFPDDENFIEYLRELNIVLAQPQPAKDYKSSPKPLLTESEKKYIEARKLWTDVVADIEQKNIAFKQKSKVEEKIMDRFRKLGITSNTKRIYEDCVVFMQTHSSIVVTFNASFLQEGITDFQPLNIFEKLDIRALKGGDYESSRNETEIELFEILTSDLRTKFTDSPQARPRYGALILLDPKHMIEPVVNYGKSFLVLDHKIKFNSLFNPADSLDHKHLHHKPCSYFQMDILLFQMSDSLLKSLVSRVTEGTLPDTYQQQYSHGWEDGYIEVMLPAINIFDPGLVQHIHIDRSEYKLSSEESALISSRGIAVTNDFKTPYPAICDQIARSINNNQVAEVKKLLNTYPSLVLMTDDKGSSLLYVAADLGYEELVKLLIAKGANPNQLGPNGKSPLHIAIGKGHQKVVELLIDTPGINIDLCQQHRMTTTGFEIKEKGHYRSPPLELAGGKGEILNLIEFAQDRKQSEIHFKKLKQFINKESKNFEQEERKLQIIMPRIQLFIEDLTLSKHKDIAKNKHDILLGYLINEREAYVAEYTGKHFLRYFGKATFSSFVDKVKSKYEIYLKTLDLTVSSDKRLLQQYQNSIAVLSKSKNVDRLDHPSDVQVLSSDAPSLRQSSK